MQVDKITIVHETDAFREFNLGIGRGYTVCDNMMVSRR